MNIKLYQSTEFFAQREIELKLFEFPGGEVGVKILPGISIASSTFEIDARITSSKDIMAVAMLKNALDEIIKYNFFSSTAKIFLKMPYVPYARQDRVCDFGESNSIKVFAGLINSMKFDKVMIFDPHSDVTPALIDNVVVTSQHEIFRKVTNESKILKRFFEDGGDNVVYVAPDAGATKKIFKISNNVAVCNKIRDPKDGKILGMELSSGDVNGKDCLLLDDICDGGRTFIECARVLKEKGAKTVGLYVTHGILSKGTAPLKESLDFIVTTDSFGVTEEYGFLERIKI